MLIEAARCIGMAVVKNNPVLEGFSGMLGRTMVFRQMNGKTIVQSAPVRTAPYNEAQRRQQGRFREAMAYARRLLANPEVKAAYTARAKTKGWHLNAFNLAVSEYLSTKEVGPALPGLLSSGFI